MRRALITIALVLVAASAHAQDTDGDANRDRAAAPNPVRHTSLYRDGFGCSGPPPVDPGSFTPIGANQRDLQFDTSAATNGDVFGGTLHAVGAPRIDDNVALLVGVSTGVAYRSALPTVIASTPVFELGISVRSDCDGFHILGTVEYAPPVTTPGSPHDWQATMAAVPVVGPWSSLTLLPRADFGGMRFTFDARARTNWNPVFLWGRFGFRAGFAYAGSQYGTLLGFAGALSVEVALGIHPANLMLGVRAEFDLSAFWPANAIAPFAATFPIRWSPDRAISMEAWFGWVGLFVHGAADLPSPGWAGGLAVTTFVDI